MGNRTRGLWLAVALACGVCSKAKTETTEPTTAPQVHPACDGYLLKGQASGETASITITDTTPQARYVATLNFNKAAAAADGFVFDAEASELVDDAAPAATARLTGAEGSRKLCAKFGPEDSSGDACLAAWMKGEGLCGKIAGR
jgi:hypothetical protein